MSTADVTVIDPVMSNLRKRTPVTSLTETLLIVAGQPGDGRRWPVVAE